MDQHDTRQHSAPPSGPPQPAPHASPPFVELRWHAEARTALAAHRIVLLVGPPGAGKTAFARYECAASTGLPANECQGTPDLEATGLFGRYTLIGDTTPFVDGPLTRALKSGSWMVLNDVGSVPFAELSNLLPLRCSEDNSVWNPVNHDLLAVPPHFRLLLTMQQESAACRGHRTAMQSLIDGSLVVEVGEPNPAEMRAILRAHQPSLEESELDRLLEIRERFLDLARADDQRRQVPIGVRSMLQLAALLRRGMPEGIAVGQAIVGKFLLQPDKFDAARLASQVRSAW